MVEKSFFIEDLDVSEVSNIVHAQIQQDRQTMTADNQTPVPTLTNNNSNLSLDVPVAQHIRINLIRHRYARTTDMPILQLFKTFLHTLRKVDKNITILPYDSKKQQYTSIVSNKQIDNLNKHQMKLYFQPWHHEQYYLLSGFIHFSSMYTFEELFSQSPLIEWLDTYQYSTKKCSSQAEEMTIIGIRHPLLWQYLDSPQGSKDAHFTTSYMVRYDKGTGNPCHFWLTLT